MKNVFTLITIVVMALSASAQNTYGIFMDETTIAGKLLGVTEEAIGYTPGVKTADDVKVTYTNGKDTKYIAELEKTFGACFFLNAFNYASFQYKPYIADGSVNATWSLMDGGVLVCTGYQNGTDETAAGFIDSDADAGSRWPEYENNDETQPRIDYFSKNLYEIAPDYWTGMTIEVPAGQALSVDEISVAIGGGYTFYWSVAIFNEAGELLYDSKVAQAQNNFNSTDAAKQSNICGFSADITAAGVAEPLAGYNFMPKSWHSSAGYFDNFIGETALPITLEKADKMKAAGWDPTNGKSPVRKFQPLPADLKLTGKNTVRVYFGCKRSRLFGLPYLYVKGNVMGNIEECDKFESDGIYYDVINNTGCDVQVISGDNKYSGNITIPEKVMYNGKEYSVKSIASCAFSRCSELNSLTIPNSVTSIGDSVFYDCSSLMEVNIPDSIACIGDYVFYGCSALSSVTIPNTVTSIGHSVFRGCSSLSIITIPNSVTSIEESVFYGCTGLRSITIPNSVTSIGMRAFYGCSSLNSIVIPNSVTNIGIYAFSSCSSLTSVSIGNSVTSIGKSTFADCSNLVSLSIPSSVTKIVNSAFLRCTNLSKIEVKSGNSKYDSRDNCNAIIETETNTLIIGCKNTIVPNSVTTIGSHAFTDCKSLVSLTIPNSVKGIDLGAFEGCSSLTSLEIGNSVASIGSNAFEGCSSLTTITIPNSVTFIGRGAFRNCIGITSLIIGNSLTSIERNTFDGCSSLTSLVISNSVTTIGSHAFAGCKKITSLSIPNSVTSIEEYAFYDTGWYNSQPDGLLYFDNWLIEYRGEMPDNTTVNIKEGTRGIANSAFRDCSGLTSVTFSNSLVSIGESAFRDCSGLTSVTFPDSLVSIGESAFRDCLGLISVNIPNSVMNICDLAFSDCSSLSSLIIGNSVSSIGKQAFIDCRSLTTITIPNSVTSIGGNAFNRCVNLTSVISEIKEPFAIQSNVFHEVNAPLYVPAGTKTLYEATEGWNLFTDIIEKTEDLEPENNENKDYGNGGDINEDTNLDGNVVDNIFYNITPEDGGYNSTEGCIVLNTPVSDDKMNEMEGQDIFGEDFREQYTGIVFKVNAGKGNIKVTAESKGNMTLKLKVGNNDPLTISLTGKMTVSMPYDVDNPSYVYIYGSNADNASTKGMNRTASVAEDALKIYGISWTNTDKPSAIYNTNVDAQKKEVKIYNINGQLVNNPTHGLYIINGRKMMK